MESQKVREINFFLAKQTYSSAAMRAFSGDRFGRIEPKFDSVRSHATPPMQLTMGGFSVFWPRLALAFVTLRPLQPLPASFFPKLALRKMRSGNWGLCF